MTAPGNDEPTHKPSMSGPVIATTEAPTPAQVRRGTTAGRPFEALPEARIGMRVGDCAAGGGDGGGSPFGSNPAATTR